MSRPLNKVIVLSLIILINTVSSYDSNLFQYKVSLILMTQQNHEPITKINDLSKISNCKSLSIEPQNFENFIGELTNYVKSKNVDNKLLSSFYTKMNQLSEIKFEGIKGIEQLITLYENKENILLHVLRKAPRLLEQTQVKPVRQTITNSKMFINMTPATLTGLLVSLFLIVILLIAINCLYNVKTNDQYGRNHLWVGKES